MHHQVMSRVVGNTHMGKLRSASSRWLQWPTICMLFVFSSIPTSARLHSSTSHGQSLVYRTFYAILCTNNASHHDRTCTPRYQIPQSYTDSNHIRSRSAKSSLKFVASALATRSRLLLALLTLNIASCLSLLLYHRCRCDFLSRLCLLSRLAHSGFIHMQMT